MTDEFRCRLCLIGLPRTGKTTYIAALWSYLISGLPEGSLRVTDFPDDPAYLNQIAEAWAAGAAMPRNSLGATDRIEFSVETAAGTALTIVLPDLPGELFRNALIRPTIDEDTRDAVVGSDLLLFFVNGETAKTYSALGDYEPEQDPETNAPRPRVRDFAIGNLDADTLNTELLQRVRYLCRDRELPALAVVVAAWDSNQGVEETPRQWLEREQPMLSQIVDEYERSAVVGVLGVSAQGANYGDDPTIVEKLAGDRPWACDEAATRTDIAGPLRWYDGLTAGEADEPNAV